MKNKNLEEQRIAYSKVVLCSKFIDEQLTVFQDNYDKAKKQALKLAQKSLDRFLRMVSPEIITQESSLDNDIDLFNVFFDSAIYSELCGELDAIEYKNDLNFLLTKYKERYERITK